MHAHRQRMAAMDRIAGRLSAVDGLYYPTSFLRSAPDHKAALLALLSRDSPLFLERYGGALSHDELAAFDALAADYEVGWHLRRLRAALAGGSPPASRVRNRRRAYLDRLVREGEYFSEEAMREREPYLHHEYLGRFQDPTGRAMARPGERWSETLMRRAEEAVIVEKIRGEQIRRGVDPSEWAAQILGKPDLAPMAWVKRLVTLCDKAPATPIYVVRDVVEEQFGKSFDDIFECFNVEPVGFASIALVRKTDC
ncbi:hypothetical protein E2562_037086 [Oryza meyeriana var. granulata]|uniref:Uncharacterized protein n=1 Tax=Oryza meyeriana var. granulata TaxID=110450 RepID=A0A6G1CLB3_9ORYZ|nr:hypothetical protein E2562_037086 [Oryza meyeriana var. granulata]